MNYKININYKNYIKLFWLYIIKKIKTRTLNQKKSKFNENKNI